MAGHAAARAQRASGDNRARMGMQAAVGGEGRRSTHLQSGVWLSLGCDAAHRLHGSCRSSALAHSSAVCCRGAAWAAAGEHPTCTVLPPAQACILVRAQGGRSTEGRAWSMPRGCAATRGASSLALSWPSWSAVEAVQLLPTFAGVPLAHIRGCPT
jgi:hypothetical protein